MMVNGLIWRRVAPNFEPLLKLIEPYDPDEMERRELEEGERLMQDRIGRQARNQR